MKLLRWHVVVVGLGLLYAATAIAAEPLEPGDELLPEPDRAPASIETDRKAAKSISDPIVTLVKATDAKAIVTSTFREGSRAHRRGAVDIAGTDGDRAQVLSKKLGAGYLIIIEDVDVAAKKQTNTYYCGGKLWRAGKKPNPDKQAPMTAFSSTGNPSHTHIQKQPAGGGCE